MPIFDTFFGGGENKAAKQQAKGAKSVMDAINKAKEYYEPYSQAGRRSITNYENALSPISNAENEYYAGVQRMANPADFYEQMLAGYDMSPAAKYRLNKGLDVLENQSAAAGMLGSGQLRKDITDYSQDIIGSDQQQYLQNLLGIYGNYLSGVSNVGQDYLGGQQYLYNTGYNAAGNQANLMRDYGAAHQQYYNARANQERARAEAASNALAFAGQTGADYATGGATAVIRPFTSSSQSRPQAWRNPDYY